MAGHSKFKNIQHRKGAQDKKRGKIFARCAREITVAVKEGGPDPDMNPRLRLAIANAKSLNTPNDNIARAIKAGTGEGEDGVIYEDVRYEGYGPGGTAIIVETLTENRNRTASEVRSTFAKYGGNLGETGSVGFMFDRMGEIIYPSDKASEDEMFEAAVEAGADNVESGDETHDIYTAADDFASVQEALASKYGDPERAGLTWKPNVNKDVDEDTASSVLKLIEMLDDLDDVQSVYTNFDVSDEILAKLTASG